MKNVKPVNSEAVTLVREFKAPRSLVFKAFSQPEHLTQWWGPAGYEMSVLHFDFRPGGIFHYKMVSEEMTMMARFVYSKIKKPELIEFVLSFTNEKAEIIRAPFFGNWPLEIFNSLSFTEQGEKTIITFVSYPVNATTEETQTFIRESASLRGGMTSSFDRLGLLLTQLSVE